jgi:N-methylhydantoinase B
MGYARGLLHYTERMMRTAIGRIPDGVYTFADEMDDEGIPREQWPVSDELPGSERGPQICVQITVQGDGMIVDFAGSSPAVPGPLNAVRAITESATWYVARCVAGEDVPVNSGTFAPVQVQIPHGSILDADPPHAVAGGNVETSQRVVDAVLGALAQALPDLIPAASLGTMNNLTVGGQDCEQGTPFAYYETVGGGAGGGPQGDGLSGTHVHMTNTLNTPVEALEYAYPIRVRCYVLRQGSGGDGLHRGGDGLVRDIEFLCPATVTILSERRRVRHTMNPGHCATTKRTPHHAAGSALYEQNDHSFSGSCICFHIASGGDALTSLNRRLPRRSPWRRTHPRQRSGQVSRQAISASSPETVLAPKRSST